MQLIHRHRLHVASCVGSITRNLKLPPVLIDAVEFAQHAATLFLGCTHASLPSSRARNQVVDLLLQPYSLSCCGKRRQLFFADSPPEFPDSRSRRSLRVTFTCDRCGKLVCVLNCTPCVYPVLCYCSQAPSCYATIPSLPAVCQVLAQSGLSILMRGTKGLSTYNVKVVRFGTNSKTMKTWLRKSI